MPRISQDVGAGEEVTQWSVMRRYWKELTRLGLLVVVVAVVLGGGGFVFGYLAGQHSVSVVHNPTSAQNFSDTLWFILVLGVSIALVFHGLPFQFKSIHNTQIIQEQEEE